MSQLFTAFLLTSLIGTILALILTLLRPVTEKIFSCGWHYYMWLLVLLVMVLPIRLELPEADVISPPVTEAFSITNINGKNTEISEIDVNGERTTIKNFTKLWYDILPLLSLIWLIGAAFLFLIKLTNYIIALLKIQKNTYQIPCPEIKNFTNRKVRTMVSDAVCSPLMIGIIKPTLLLPKKNIEPYHLHNILAHEMTHLNRNDILYKWLVSIVKCIHWFNPVIYFIADRINIDCEISCDASVVENMDEAQRKMYAETILSLLTKTNINVIPLTTGMTSNRKTLKRRFTMIKNNKKIGKKATIISVLLAALVLVAAFFGSGILNGAYNGGDSNENQDSICALVKEIKGDTVILDIVEYITIDNTDRIAELNLSEFDMINGYYIYNAEIESNEYILTDSTIYSFIDWKNDFVKEGEDRQFFATNKEDFIKYLSTYENSQPKMPFFIVVDGNKIVSITEKIMM